MKTSTNQAFIAFDRDRRFRNLTDVSGPSPKSVTIKRNPRSRSNGIVGHVPPEIAVTMVRNTQLEEIRRRMIDFQALSPEDRILSKVGEPEITLREAVTTASRRHAV